MSKEIVAIRQIAQVIRFIRREKVLLDSDLAILYGVSTKMLNQAVKRNAGRFPEDFMFQLTAEEVRSLRSQFVTLNLQTIGNKAITLAPPTKSPREIGFHVREKSARYRARNSR